MWFETAAECGKNRKFDTKVQDPPTARWTLIQTFYSISYDLFHNLVNDVKTYTRSCYWEQENVPSNSCAVQKYNPSYVKTLECNTCVEDGCNDKLISDSVVADITNKSAENQKNSAPIMAMLSHAVFVIFMLSIVIGY